MKLRHSYPHFNSYFFSTQFCTISSEYTKIETIENDSHTSTHSYIWFYEKKQVNSKECEHYNHISYHPQCISDTMDIIKPFVYKPKKKFNTLKMEIIKIEGFYKIPKVQNVSVEERRRDTPLK